MTAANPLTTSLEAYIEYARATNRFSDVALYERLLRRIALLERRDSLLERKFTSGNSVEVDRVTITREEWYV